MTSINTRGSAHDTTTTAWTHTRRGTRPGSPLADIAFNMMMAELPKELNEMLLDSDELVAGATALGTFVPPIAWMDDIAISLATTHSSRLTPLIEYTIAAVHGAFKRPGLSLNLDPGKRQNWSCAFVEKKEQ